MHRRALLGLLLVSGFAGLAWELLWVRLLTLSLGGTTLSFSTVLAVFFGGLALGSRWAGKRSRTVARPVRAYALLELLTGVVGVALYPLMVHLGRLIAVVDLGSTSGALAVRVAVAVALLLPPTFLLGATLPFVSVAVVRDDRATGSGTAFIYGLNTLGACLGAWAVSFVLLPTLGVLATVLVVAGLNALAGGAAWWLSSRPGGDGRVADEGGAEAPAASPLSKEGRVILLAAFVGGLFATGSQVVWGRTFAIVLRGTTYALGSVLVSVLVGIALGSLLAGALSTRVRSLAAAALGAQALQLVGGAAFVATLPLAAYALNTLSQAGWSATALHHADIVVVWLSLLIPTVASGAALPLLVGVMERKASNLGDTLSRLYAANTAGCIVGSVAVGFWGLPAIGSGGSLYGLAFLMAAAVSIFAVVVVSDRRLVAGAGVVVALGVVAAFPDFDASVVSSRNLGASPDFFTLRRQQLQAQSAQKWRKEGDSATATVRGTEGSSGLTLNGLGQGGRNAEPPHIVFESLLVAAFPWVHAPGHERGLVIGLGAGGTVSALVQLGVTSLEVVELEDAVREAVELIWQDQNPLLRPGVKLVRDDARHHLLLASHRQPGSYDFITSMPAHPWVAPALFTREFFAIARENLSERGVFSTWFGTGGLSPDAIDALFGAFASEFPHVLVYDVPQTGAYYVLGSRAPITFDVRRFEALFASTAAVGLGREQRSASTFGAMVAAAGPGRLSPTQLVSTDDNAIIEFSVPDPTRQADPLSLFEQRALSPASVVGAPVEAFWLDVVERAFGTASGRLPQPTRPVETVARLESGLGPKDTELRGYLKARLAALKGNRDEALAAARALTEPTLAERAMVFALTTGVSDTSPGPLREATLSGLEAFLHRADVRAFRLGLGADDAGPSLAAPTPADDALGWLFVSDAAAIHPAPDEAALAGGNLLRRAAAFPSRAVAARTEATARSWQAPDLVPLAEQLTRRAIAQRQNQRLRAALEAGSRERFAEAITLLLEAAEHGPLDTERIKLLLRASIKTGNAAARIRAESMLATRGYTPDTIAALRDVFRRQLDEAERAAAPPPTAP
jgi:spermidine synthase